MKSNLTFVTSYFKIYDSDYEENKSFEKRLELFIKIVELGINICIFTSSEYKIIMENLSQKYDNLKIIEILSIEDFQMYKLLNVNKDFLQLPERRSNVKDTFNYMLLMNSKTEFLYKTIVINPFNNEYFCWFDFSLPYIFKDIERTLNEIKKHAFRNYIDSFIAIPGCWNHKVYDINFLKKQVVWRFCGGFFIGDKQSLIKFYDLSIKYFLEFLKVTNTLMWEVNYWAWLEKENYINPIWYEADHNDSIINIPQYLYRACIKKYSTKILTYPLWDSNIFFSDNNSIIYDKFYASSSSYIYDFINNKHILNTRYVNYHYKDNWDCDFFPNNPMRQIRNVNVKSELNNETMEPVPLQDCIMNIDDSKFKTNSNAYSVGLEDIRLYYDNDTLKFIASNFNYSETDKNTHKIIIGDYDYKNTICKNMKIINMMWETSCEKNWVPLPNYNDINGAKLFIYKWNPFIIGFINDNNFFQTIIERKYENNLIGKLRGSTPFINFDDNTFIGVVHYSEPGQPPIYYHCLVLLDNKSNLPLFYSDPFKFSEKPIEFCIGFTIIKEEYLFWVSQMDREPFLIKFETDKIHINNKF